jgi:CheY-like chemotaxis protein
MNKKLNLIMLVDDDLTTNLYNEIIIQDLNITDEIEVFQNGKLALDYLTTLNEEGKYPQPEILFLDINMPIMNGWEFLEQHDKLQQNQKAIIILAMLTSSVNPEDKVRALKFNSVKEFINKPLIEENLEELIIKYFKDR